MRGMWVIIGIPPLRGLITPVRNLLTKSYDPLTRFSSSPLIVRVPFFLLFGFNKGTPPKKKGKRVLLGNLVK